MLENASGLRISVLVSGGGTNFQAVIDGVEEGIIKNAKIVQVISSKDTAYALTRAKNHNIKGKVIDKKTYPDTREHTQAVLKALEEEGTNLIVLAGYMRILQPEVIQKYAGKIINIHPSLIPKYCGVGFYGSHVHQAVIEAGEKESGATVHFVDEGVDTGKIILQEKVMVDSTDTAESLAAKVLKVEHKIIQQAIVKVLQDLEKEEWKEGGN